VPLFIFAASYLLMVNITFRSRQAAYIVLALFLVPLTLGPYSTPLVPIAVLGGLYILAMAGLYQYFRRFPWSTEYWTGDQLEEMKRTALKQNVLGWPFKFLSVCDAPGVSIQMSLVAGLMAVWWTHLLSRRFGFELGFAVPVCSFYVALFRLARYIGFHRSPISLLGRISTGRLIIPQHDKVFLAPLCVLLCGTALPVVLYLAGLKVEWVLKGSVFLVVFLGLALPPTMKEWQLTGAHRLRRAAMTIGPKQTMDPRVARISEWFKGR